MSNEERMNGSGEPTQHTEPPPPLPINLTLEQVRLAAGAGVDLLGRESTLTPGSLRRELAVLEAVLQAIASGVLVVALATQVTVESELDNGDRQPVN